jgi:PTH1 family peptidyl-tRNA hydrolase
MAMARFSRKQEKTGGLFLIVGLGNPGDEYRETRHNIGFMVADHFRHTRDMGRTKRRYQGRWCEDSVRGCPTALLLPQTFMNCSGDAVADAASSKHIPPQRIIVVHDDMDFPFGTVRVKQGGGTGGHNGLKSIVSRLGTDQFNRVRVGIGRPEDPSEDQKDWVLSPLEAGAEELRDLLDRSADCVETIIVMGIETAMNRCNRREADTTDADAAAGGAADDPPDGTPGNTPAT